MAKQSQIFYKRMYPCVYTALKEKPIFKTTMCCLFSRHRTPTKIIGYDLYLCFLGLTFRNTAKALSFLHIINISHISIWNWIQKYRRDFT